MNILTPTADGSNTLFNEQVGEHYHSKHGAVQESRHVFIRAGLEAAMPGKHQLAVFEVGFGTGLNFLLSLDTCLRAGVSLHYTAVEAFPLSFETIADIGYRQFVMPAAWQAFEQSYGPALQAAHELPLHGKLEIATGTFQTYGSGGRFDVLYYDAFSVRHQPEMWTDELITRAAALLKPGGLFVTYAITGKLKRALKACGCTIEKLPGAPGKREMLRATRQPVAG
ncbi:tRNA (5-methylaminomethyl-2-thiouridylate)-methyltransferase [Pedobacter yulinensis]|uniref:tRNA (5-methylaminomethyl-2-thiouridylate)-methyltransferase n=1 Tax=Pedobacter yulinensis TaxID=2126353 RepID=A0A2T3HHJ7_9SPHI|nr:tRNA (5-methylaminomethyl-2-thiouridine)(34)-methyltransferase MnmD [Pedobacter yulinensis]PST81915.1 tRNA (5-methylaminomethyl-2-thiouridylate)-methyltransferase [Pedobacter yulinensis]